MAADGGRTAEGGGAGRGRIAPARPLGGRGAAAAERGGAGPTSWRTAGGAGAPPGQRAARGPGSGAEAARPLPRRRGPAAGRHRHARRPAARTGVPGGGWSGGPVVFGAAGRGPPAQGTPPRRRFCAGPGGLHDDGSASGQPGAGTVSPIGKARRAQQEGPRSPSRPPSGRRTGHARRAGAGRRRAGGRAMGGVRRDAAGARLGDHRGRTGRRLPGLGVRGGHRRRLPQRRADHPAGRRRPAPGDRRGGGGGGRPRLLGELDMGAGHPGRRRRPEGRRHALRGPQWAHRRGRGAAAAGRVRAVGRPGGGRAGEQGAASEVGRDRAAGRHRARAHPEGGPALALPRVPLRARGVRRAGGAARRAQAADGGERPADRRAADRSRPRGGHGGHRRVREAGGLGDLPLRAPAGAVRLTR
ncbi:hypothetical protein SGPA1_10325 [Streptomyces misionensis JCM 4497]